MASKGWWWAIFMRGKWEGARRKERDHSFFPQELCCYNSNYSDLRNFWDFLFQAQLGALHGPPGVREQPCMGGSGFWFWFLLGRSFASLWFPENALPLSQLPFSLQGTWFPSCRPAGWLVIESPNPILTKKLGTTAHELGQCFLLSLFTVYTLECGSGFIVHFFKKKKIILL